MRNYDLYLKTSKKYYYWKGHSTFWRYYTRWSTHKFHHFFPSDAWVCPNVSQENGPKVLIIATTETAGAWKAHLVKEKKRERPLTYSRGWCARLRGWAALAAHKSRRTASKTQENAMNDATPGTTRQKEPTLLSPDYRSAKASQKKRRPRRALHYTVATLILKSWFESAKIMHKKSPKKSPKNKQCVFQYPKKPVKLREEVLPRSKDSRNGTFAEASGLRGSKWSSSSLTPQHLNYRTKRTSKTEARTGKMAQLKFQSHLGDTANLSPNRNF